jgi:hypothetical protein
MKVGTYVRAEIVVLRMKIDLECTRVAAFPQWRFFHDRKQRFFRQLEARQLIFS